jgi:hypothetical protein
LSSSASCVGGEGMIWISFRLSAMIAALGSRMMRQT